MPEEERTKNRSEILVPLLDEYWESLGTIQAANGSSLDKAVQYSLNQKEQLNNVLLDNRIELTTIVRKEL
ncbi:MAG: IS66 family transposase [Ruminococcus sp.]|nr:IS66 family transposase [Ruminococcus sp.]